MTNEAVNEEQKYSRIDIEDFMALDAAGKLAAEALAIAQATPEWKLYVAAQNHARALRQRFKVPGDVQDFKGELAMVTPMPRVPLPEPGPEVDPTAWAPDGPPTIPEPAPEEPPAPEGGTDASANKLAG